MGKTNGSAFLEVLNSIKAPYCLSHQHGLMWATMLVTLQDPDINPPSQPEIKYFRQMSKILL